MNQSSNPLDRFFRKKLQDRPVEMDMAHWQAAAEMLDADRKNKKRGFLWFGGIAFLAMIAVGIVLWGRADSKVLLTGQAAGSANPDYYKIIDSEQNVDQSAELISNQPEAATDHSNNAQAISSTKPGNVSHLELSKSKGQDSQTSDVIDETSALNTSAKNVSTDLGQQESIGKSSVNNSIKTGQKQADVEVNNALGQKVNQALNENISQENFGNIAEQSIDSDNRIEQDNSSYSKQAVLSNFEERHGSWVTGKIKFLRLLPVRNPIVEDWSSNLEHLAGDIDDEFSPQFKMGFYLEGMLNASNASQDVFAGFRLGLLGQYHFSPKLALQFEPGYHQQTGLAFYSKLRQDNIYDFGVNTETFAMLAETAHFLSLPISLKYQLKKHGFEGGVDLNYLLGVQGDVQEVTLMNVTDPNDLTRSAKVNEVVESLNAGWLDMAPFASLTNRFFVGYNYLVNRGFTVGARAYYQPNPLLENAPSTLIKPNHTKLLIGLQAKFIIE